MCVEDVFRGVLILSTLGGLTVCILSVTVSSIPCWQLKQVREENRKVVENYTSERTMRKKYYNMVEDMKGSYLSM